MESRMKNRTAQKYPPGISWKIFGRVMKIRASPSSGFMLNANTAGNMATPARMAIRVSAAVMA